MTSKPNIKRAMTSLSMLLIATSVLGQNSQAAEPGGKGTADATKCPVMAETKAPDRMPTEAGAYSNDDWWPNQLNLKILEQNSTLSNPMGEKFNYAAEFKKVDLNELKKDVDKLMVTSQDWWPADFGTYAGLFIRMAWHSAGTYRVSDGRGGASYGTQRFAPLNSWPDNVSLDKARRLLWPIKQKYGDKLSWADLMVFTGNCALESAGLKTIGYGGGREDVWEPQEDIYWGPESKWMGDQRFTADKKLMKPLAADTMGLIYVNPQGPDGKPDPLESAKHIRITFGNMAMNDYETVALIAGGHTLGKSHGAASPDKYLGREPEAAGIEEQGFGWKNSYGKGNGTDAITSGLEGAWTSTPTKWSNSYLNNLFGLDWVLGKGPGGGYQWAPKQEAAKLMVPDAQDSTKRHPPMMFTTDIALKMDPIYGPIAKHFQENPEELKEAFAKAWFKLTHRDMGPVARLLGSQVPPAQPWQDPVPAVDHELIGAQDIATLKAKILGSGLTIPQLVSTAWESASTFRGSDKRGGANGARIRLAPQKDWEVNNPPELAKVLQTLQKVQQDFNSSQSGGKKVSLADVIVLGGCAGVEAAAKNGGHDIQVPFTPGRTDATQELTDVQSFGYLEPTTDGFRNFRGHNLDRPVEEKLIDRAQLLTLTAPEMTVLLGGLRVLNTNANSSQLGVLTKQPEKLTNDFFVNLLDMSTVWSKSSKGDGTYEGKDRKTGNLKWTGSAVDLVFGSNSQLRAISEVYASDDAKDKFVNDFVAVWNKVMNLDRFDLEPAVKFGSRPIILGQR